MTSVRLVFHNSPVNPDKLGLLTDEELFCLAEKMGLNLPPDLDRIFVLEEIMEAFDDESEDRKFSHDAPGHVEEKKFSGPGFSDYSPAGKIAMNTDDRYGETRIHVIARDPGWVFAYWDIAEGMAQGRDSEESSPVYFLRVCETAAGHDSRRDYFDIPIASGDYQWYINMPHPGSRYRIDLCIHSGARSRTIARSNDVILPKQYVGNDVWCDDSATHTLLLLSGSRALNIAPPVRSNPNRILADGE